MRDEITGKLTEAQTVAEQLKSGSSEEVVKALREILVSEDSVKQEFPMLQQHIDQARPTHLYQPLLRAALMANVPAWLYGEAGSGKSTAAARSAGGLDLPFRSISLGPSSSKSDLMGYRDGHGEYQSTSFREVYEQGGVFLFDEIDNAHPSILTLLNSAIANGHGEFPDSRVTRHETARFVAAANTIGKGATAEYVGRAPIDAATLDRFAFIPMDIDPDLEDALVLGTLIEREPLDVGAGGVPDEREWLAEVRAHREAAQELGIRTIISPRAALYGVALSNQGVGLHWLREMLLYKGMRETDKEKLACESDKLLSKHVESIAAKAGQKPGAKTVAVAEGDIPHAEEVQDSGSFQPPKIGGYHIGRDELKKDPAYNFEEGRDCIFSAINGQISVAELDSNKSAQILLGLCWSVEEYGPEWCAISSDDLSVIADRFDEVDIFMSGFVHRIDRFKRLKEENNAIDSIEHQDVFMNNWEAFVFGGNDDSGVALTAKKSLEQLGITSRKKLEKALERFSNEYGFKPGFFTLANWLLHRKK